MSGGDRHSQALEAELIRYPELRAIQEVQNGLKQFQLVVEWWSTTYTRIGAFG